MWCDQCERCHNKGKECYSSDFKCYLPFHHLLNLHQNYVNEKIKDLNNYEILLYRNKMTFNIWIRDILIPLIQDKDIFNEAKRLYELPYQI